MFTFAGLSIFSGSIKDVIKRVQFWRQQNKSAYICVTGAHGIVEAKRDKRVLISHTASDLVVPDGMPLVWVGRAMGQKDTKRIYGPDLCISLCEEAERRGWKILFYGTTEQTLTRLVHSLKERFPKLLIVGSIAPPFRSLTKVEDMQYIKAINKAKPDVVFLGLSTPKQELWMHDHLGKIHNAVLVGVGAAFDFIAGTKKQAPQWMRVIGLEWLYRFGQEPKRLAKRYVISNSMFLYYSVRSLPSYLLLSILFVVCATISVHGSGEFGTIGVAGIFFFETYYLYAFLRYAWSKPSLRLIAISCITISIGIYGVFFRYINNLELWVDEIQVIRFSQLPLGKIAHEVMTKHVAVPPLDYWNMWAWNRVASSAQVSIIEFMYRVPYMVMHIAASTLVVMVLYEALKKNRSQSSIWILCVGYLLYFINPLLFVYSYEVRFYSLSFLGVIIIAALFYEQKLFHLKYLPLVLLFCLASAYQFILVAPFVIIGIADKTTRKMAQIFGAAFIYMAAMILPYLYVPNSISSVYASVATASSLDWLRHFYFDSPWKIYCAGASGILLLAFKNKRALLVMMTTLFCSFVVIALDNIFNYQYFGFKHFLFILPFFTLVVCELFFLFRSIWYQVMMTMLIVAMFIFPFYQRLNDIHTNKLFFAKSPLGLKILMNIAQKDKSPIIVEYGNINREDVSYYKLAISWYVQLYKEVNIQEFYNLKGCGVTYKIMYSPFGMPGCIYKSNIKITPYFDSNIIEEIY